MKYSLVLLLFSMVCLQSCQHNNSSKNTVSKEAQKFIDHYTEEYMHLYMNSMQAQWMLSVDIKQRDRIHMSDANKFDKAMAIFTGSEENIENARKYLNQKNKITDIQRKQLEKILYLAANNSHVVANLVSQRIKIENEQTHKLQGYQYFLDGRKVSNNDLEDILKNETNLNIRLTAWEASKQVGPILKGGLVTLCHLRNNIVRSLGYHDFFTYQVSSYDMKTNEMMYIMKGIMKDLYPLYRELHTWMRYELAKKYGVRTVPDYLPAHWLPDRWGQDWSSVIRLKGMNDDGFFQDKAPDWIIKSAENLYVSLGYPKLPETFWKSSSLYFHSSNSVAEKNIHPSAWHINLDQDVRSLMRVKSNAKSFRTAHHELGHVYYYLAYSNKDVPPLLRAGANRAYHEAIGTMMGLAAMQKPYLTGRGLIGTSVTIDSTQALLKEALSSVVFIYFSAGTMTQFEKSMYMDNLSPDQYNWKWWELAKKYQGIVPPSKRGEEFCDAATKTHVHNDSAQYYDYALAYVLLYQLHNYIAKNILHQDPHATDYFGQKRIGDFMMQIMRPGATKDWRQVLKISTGEEFSATAMKEYFEPLKRWLQIQNKGRKYTLPKIID